MNHDTLRYLDMLDAIDGDDEGTIPLAALDERGITMPPDGELGDEELHERLWQVIRGIAELGLFLENTDHLSDRELYRYLREDALLVPEFLAPDDLHQATHLSPIGGFSEEDIEVYLRYYADDQTRTDWKRDYPEDALPAKLPPPYDRDRLLPTREGRVALRQPA